MLEIGRCLRHAYMPGRDDLLALHQWGYDGRDGVEFVDREGEGADCTLREIVAQDGIGPNLYRDLREQAEELPSAADAPEEFRIVGGIGVGNAYELAPCRHERGGDDVLATVAAERRIGTDATTEVVGQDADCVARANRCKTAWEVPDFDLQEVREILMIGLNAPAKCLCGCKAAWNSFIKVPPLTVATLLASSTSTPVNRLRSMMTPGLPMDEKVLCPPEAGTKGTEADTSSLTVATTSSSMAD